jgi:hypothetical protein
MVNVARRVFFCPPASQVLLRSSRPENVAFLFRGYLGTERRSLAVAEATRQYCRPALKTRYWPTGLGPVTSKAKRKRGRSSPG